VRRTPLYERHFALGAKIVEFGGWNMPVQYPAGILEEHLATRRGAGLFDVCHMGRFRVRGPGALGLLQQALSNDASVLEPGRAQYTMIPEEQGGARDDAYLYHLGEADYLLVVNAANRQADWDYLRSLAARFSGAELVDASEELAMLSLQGPQSARLLGELLGPGALPEPGRNRLHAASGPGGMALTVASTGYAGEALGYELFLPAGLAVSTWDRLLSLGAVPVGLGARDTLRLEAGLPLYGHELGLDPEGRPIPIFACPLARFAVSLGPARDFAGKTALTRQRAAFRDLQVGDFARLSDLPRRVRLLELLGPGVARQGCVVSWQGRPAGWVTSGTVAPYWVYPESPDAAAAGPSETSGKRAVAMALLDSRIPAQAEVSVDIRGRGVAARVATRLLCADSPPFTRPVLCGLQAAL
jgi:aminomethyltransferase